MNIFIENSILYAEEFFSSIGDIIRFDGKTITSDELQDADVLLTRSTTKVNSALLDKANNLKWIGTATIGTDHIDLDYLQHRGIRYSSAPGCNATSVGEYVLAAILAVFKEDPESLLNKKVGIVGAGNTGSEVGRLLKAAGIPHAFCDPPLAEKDQSREYVNLEQALECDIVTLHVPLTHDGRYPTFHLLDEQKIESLNSGALLINACRGEVVDNQALLSLAAKNHLPKLVLDVWEGEPDIEKRLLEHVCIATPHIAGHSLEGKARGTQMLYQWLCNELNIPASKKISQVLPQFSDSNIVLDDSDFSMKLLGEIVPISYNIMKDEQRFRTLVIEPSGFEKARKEYPIRREFSAYSFSTGNSDKMQALSALGFNGRS